MIRLRTARPRSGTLRVRRAALIAALLLAAPVAGSGGDGSAWRSALYPDDWTPATTGADGVSFLSDFSHAGYRAGESPVPDSVPGVTIDVDADHGADPTGASDSTDALQAALDAAAGAGGGTVSLGAGVYRVDGLLTVTGSGVVVRGTGAGSTLLQFTRGASMTGRAGLTFRGTVSRGPDVPLAMDGEQRAATVRVNDATSLSVGDDVALGWVITDAFVAAHEMTGTWQAFNGTWRPVFRRRVVAVDTATEPHTVTLDAPLHYDALVRDGASLRRETGYITECGLEHLSVTHTVDRAAAWSNDRAHAIDWNGVADCWMRDVHSAPPPGSSGDHLQSGGVLVVSSKRVTVTDCSMRRAQNRGGGGNGYLFEVSRSSDVLMRDCGASDGRHNFIQNWDFGTTGCVFLRCHSARSRAYLADWDPFGYPAYSEFHHSLSMANLVDGCRLEDGWSALNRGAESSGAGHTATGCVFWNLTGGGLLRSFQHGRGYVIGPGDLTVSTRLGLLNSGGTAPEDTVERVPDGRVLEPVSLYEDQLARRLGSAPPALRIRRSSLVDDDRPGRDRVTLRATVRATDETTSFDPESAAFSAALEGPDWSLAVKIPAGDTAWRGGRVLRWSGGGESGLRIRLRFDRARGRLTLRVKKANFAAPPTNPIGVRVELGENSATQHAFWETGRLRGRHDLTRMRVR